jgi:hypothetical protein
MPVARGNRLNTRSFIVLAATVLAIAVLFAVMLVYLADNGKDVRLGDNQFNDLNAARTAQRIRNDGPIQFPDVSGGGRVVNLSHVGDDPQTGWYIFDARAAGAARDCILDWNRDRQVFVDRCDANHTFPLDGGGLHQYAVRVDTRGRLVIDFNVDPLTTTTVISPTTTKTTPTTTTTKK